METSARFLRLLWGQDEEVISGGGSFTDEFIGPNKVLREGVFEINGSNEFEGIEYRSVITLGRLVPKKKEEAA